MRIIVIWDLRFESGAALGLDKPVSTRDYDAQRVGPRSDVPLVAGALGQPTRLPGGTSKRSARQQQHRFEVEGFGEEIE